MAEITREVRTPKYCMMHTAQKDVVEVRGKIETEEECGAILRELGNNGTPNYAYESHEYDGKRDVTRIKVTLFFSKELELDWQNSVTYKFESKKGE